MVHSMTGFGRGESSGPAGDLTVEIRTVNHRYLDVAPRLPRQLLALEEPLRKLIQGRLARGRVDVFVQWTPGPTQKPAVKVDKDLALAYYGALKEISLEIGSNQEITAVSLAGLPDVITTAEPRADLALIWPALEAATVQAVESLIAMREREGAALGADLHGRLGRVAAAVQELTVRAPDGAEAYRRRLSARIQELLGPDAADSERVVQEVVIFAEKSDVTEELQRLQSHLEQCRRELGLGRGDKPTADAADGAGSSPGAVGRKLDFLVQEMNREVNTVGAKSQDAAATTIVIEMKSELERIREQVQNIE